MNVRDLKLENLQSQNTLDSALNNGANNVIEQGLKDTLQNLHIPQNKENQTNTQDLKDFQIHQNSQDSIKEALVKDLDDNGLSPRELVLGFCLFFGVLILFFPKIYLANSIYYLSKEIASLQTTREILSEEHKKLRREREDIEFLFGVLDNLAR